MDVIIFEEHSSTLPELRSRGAGDRTLIYLDAHLDLQPINPQRLDRLKSCVTKEQVKALEKPHHMLPDRDYAYSLEDWLYPAHRLGLFNRLIWVAPPHVSVGFSEQVFAHLQQMDGVNPSELASFRVVPSGGFAGTLAGVDITICSYRQLKGLDLSGRAVIDIDTDYFIEVPGDRVWVNPREVFDACDILSSPDLVTISRSVGSGFLPMRNRYFADYLAALWERREADAAHYERLFAMDQNLGRGASGVATDALERESLSYPDCAATWYLRAMATSNREDAVTYYEKAAQLCEGYRMRLLTRVCAYPQRQLALDGAAIREMERLLIEEPQTAEQAASARAALGMIFCYVGRIDAAIDQYRQCATYFSSHPGLALEIGKALCARGRAADAVAYLRKALDDDKSRTLALVYLAQIYCSRGDLQEALECATAAHVAASAWGEVMLLMSDLWRRLGQQPKADAMTACYRLQEQQLAALIRLDTADSRLGG